ncbi:MAG: UDP-N-acetylmuramoyl-tripeptide--D-alanyl-D-alanine ligase [bacterium]|nr:UDP-N-acetylmuramoyl-tripeptide--D-alanyl-D-alanine ligase [bacterium]
MIEVMFKKRITNKLEKYVAKYFRKHPDIKLIAVAGSVGKTSSKLAIATLLSEKYRVRLHSGNHNTHLSAPLAILGIDFPGDPRNIWEWLKVFSAARKRIKAPSENEPQVIIQELGTDQPGDIAEFGRYLQPDIAVVTAVAPEHMEFFGNLNAVAREELTVADFSKMVILNRDAIAAEFSNLIHNPNFTTYGTTVSAEYNFEIDDLDLPEGYLGKFNTPEFGQIAARVRIFGEHSLLPVTSAVAVAAKMGLSAQEIASGLAKIQPVPGRMNFLRGVEGSILIDDTYNSSPAAAEAALRTLYNLPVPSRIAILGDMNELGNSSMEEHQKLGHFCDPLSLSWVITVGEEANRFLAPAARARGCQVKTCQNAIEAATFARQVLEKGAAVLLKGSQGNIYLEEATKIMLASNDDIKFLVRQDEKWQKIKDEFFQSLAVIEEDEV